MTTVLAVPETCEICNGRGRMTESMACPACSGTGVSTAEDSAKYRAVLTAVALESAQQRYAAAGAAAAGDWLREVGEAREAAAEARRNAGKVLDALSRTQVQARAVQQVLSDTQAMHAETQALVQQAGQFTPFSFPVTPPGHPTFPVTGGTSDPLLIIDSILVRELDVWGALNVSGGSGGLMTNPMTTLGDIIQAGTLGAPTRLGIGLNGQVLTANSGVAAWQNPVTGFANPLTTTGDMMYSSPGSTPQRLAIGTANQVLTVVGGLPSWQPSAAGFTNPMTTTGDIIFSNPGSTPQRLGIGSGSQVLGISGGVPAWVTNPGGFPNPMTASGDLIVGGGGPPGTPLRLGVGTNGQVLSVVGGVPAWAQPGAAIAYMFPSGDPSGTNDDAAFNAAVASLPSGGLIQMAPGAYYTKAGWTLPAQTVVAPYGSSIQGSPVSLRGSGPSTILYPVGAAITGIFYHRTTSYGAQFGLPAQPQTGFIRDLTIDGTRATGASVGLDWGDGWGYEFDIGVVNFTGAGAIGVRQINRQFWTEKNERIRFKLSNNTTALYITTTNTGSADHSSEYNMYDISIFIQANQNGIVIDGVNMGGSYMWIRGNMSSLGSSPPANLAALSIINAAGVSATDGHRWYNGGIYMKVEANPGNGLNSGNPLCMYSDGVGYIRECTLMINASQLAPSNWNGAELGAEGSINGDPGLLAALTNGAVVAHGNANPQGLVVVNNVSAAGTVASFTNTGTSPTGPPVLMQGAGAGDHMLGIQVTGDSNPRWKVDVGGDTLWGSGSAVQDVDLGRNAAGVLLVGGGTANTANIRLGIGGTGRSILSLAESGTAPGTIASTGQLYVASNGSLHYLSPAGTDTQIGPP